MKRQILAFLMLCLGLIAMAQQITKYEYWLDTSHAERTIRPAETGNLEFTIDVGNLCHGLHALNFRAQDSDGKWSSPSSSYFYCIDKESTSQGVSQYEYWLDQNAAERVTANGQGSTINLDVDISTLLTGLHTFTFRYKDNRGHWSAPQTSYFLVPIRHNGSDIQNTYEYWLDNKQGEKVQVKGYNSVIDLSLDVNTLPTGLHSLSFRATDQNGIWSAPQTSYFYIPVDMNVNQNIKAYCYWFNDAFENRITETVSPAVIPFTLDAKLTASDVVTDITPENITMADDGEGHMKLATKNILHTQYCTSDGRWTGFSVDTFAVVVNAPEVDLTGFIKNPDASDKWNGWTTEGSTIGIQSSQTWQNGGNYFRLGNTSKNEWNSSMQQTITGLPAGTYILSAKGRAAEGVEIEISVNGFTDTFPATGTEGGELTNGWTERSLIFTTDGQPFVIKVSGVAKATGKWMDIADFHLTYSNASNASLTVNMPETADMAIYKNLKLWLTSVSSKLSVTTSNAQNYTFQGLTAGVAYNLMLTNRYGQTIAQKDGIMIAEGENSITLSDLVQLCNVEAAVTDLENNNLTDKVRIAWFMKDGTPVSDDSSIKGLASGTKLLCNVSLGDSLGCIYREVKEQEYLLTKGDNDININLVPIEKASVTGKVLADNGNSVVYATVSVTEWLNGRYSKTQSVRTDSKGAFTLDCHQDSLHITIASDGYLDCIVDTVCASTAIDLGQLYLKEITGVVITPRLNYRNATEEGETEDSIFYSNADNVDYFVSNLTANSAVSDIKLQSGTIIAKSGVNVGDKLSLRIHSRKGDFEDVTAETIVAEDETAEVVFNVVEKGGLKASYEISGNIEDIAMLYNADGALVSREFYNGNSCTFSHLSDGHYTLLSMGKMLMMDAILNLSDLGAIGLKEGTDYVLSNVEIKAGKITIINNENIPQIDETLFYYTGTNTSFSANKSSVVVGNYITLTGRLDFKEEYADDVDDLSLVVDLPDGMEYVQGSAIIGTTLAPCSVDGKRLTISLNRNNYQERIRFCVVPTKGGTMMPSAYVAFSLDNEIVQPIGSATVTAKDMSISVPSTVAKPEVTVSGVAVPYSKVTVYDGTTLIGQVTAKADGNWMVKGGFIEPYNLSTHSVYANVVTPQEISMNTEVVNVLYDKNAIEVKTVTMINTAHPAGNLNLCEYKTVFDFQNPSQESPVYWYWPSYPDFTFIVDFTNNDTTMIDNVVLHVFTSSGNVRNLYPTYNRNLGTYVISDVFYSNELPETVSVSFSMNSISCCDSKQIANAFASAINLKETIEDNTIDILLEQLNSVNDKQQEDTIIEELYKRLNVLIERIEITDFEEQVKMLDEIDTSEVPFILSNAPLNITSNNTQYQLSMFTYSEHKDDINLNSYIPCKQDNGYIVYYRADGGLYEIINIKEDYHICLNYANNRALSVAKRSVGDVLLSFVTAFENYKIVIKGLGMNVNSHLLEMIAKVNSNVAKYNSQLNNIESLLEWIRVHNGETKYKSIYESLLSKRREILNLLKPYKYAIQYLNYISKAIQGWAVLSDAFYAGDSMKEWIEIIRSIENTDCPGMDDLAQAAKNYAVLVGEGYTATLAADVATLSCLDASLTNGIAALIELFLGDFAIIQGNLNKYNDIRWKGIIRNQIPVINCKPIITNHPKPHEPRASHVLDPSGYVYEAVTSNRLEGVTATIYQKVTTEDMYGDKHESIVKWDAEPYSQRNPVKTDANGLYSWDVPDGLWQVKFEKDGYETVYSDWLPVPPPQLDINVPMYQSVQPEVTGARGFESGVDFTFSKYMRPATFAEGTVTLSRDGKPVSGQLKMLNIEKEPLDGVEYVSHIKFVPDQSLNVGDEVTLTISHEVKSYCGVTMEKDYTATLVIQPEIKEIAVDSVVNVGYGSNSEIEVAVLPADAAKGKILRLQNGTPSILATNVTELTLDVNGKTKIPVSGALPGTGALRLSVENSDVSTNVKVNVTLTSVDTAAPKASIPSGSTVAIGTFVTLSCETEGATIYYTLDGSCPCNEATSLKYEQPIEINDDVLIKAIAVSPDMYESEIVEFKYMVKFNVKIKDKNDSVENMNLTSGDDLCLNDDADDNIKSIKIVEEITGANVKYTRNFANANVWQAWYVPFDVSLDDMKVAGYEVAQIHAVLFDANGGAAIAFLKLNDGIVKANTPYVVRSKTSGDVVLNTTTDLQPTHETSFGITSTYDTYNFGGVYERMVGNKWYALNKVGQFQLMGEGVYLRPFRFWMTINPYGDDSSQSASANSKMDIVVIGDGETTGIKESLTPTLSEGEGAIYNLNGQRVTSIKSGQIYIMNGKKYIAK